MKVRASEDITSITTKQPTSSALGPAGASSNLGNGGSLIGHGAGLSETTEEKNKTEFLNGETVETITEQPGRVKRLTIAVMVHAAPAEAEDEAAVAPADIDLPKVQAVVKQAVGFDAERGDEIEVMVAQFAGLETEEQQFTQIQQWEMYSQLARSSSLGLAAVVALLLGMLTIYRLRPLTIQVDRQSDRSHRRERTLAELSAHVKENPEMMKAVISAWLDGEDASPADDRLTIRKAA